MPRVGFKDWCFPLFPDVLQHPAIPKSALTISRFTIFLTRRVKGLRDIRSLQMKKPQFLDIVRKQNATESLPMHVLPLFYPTLSQTLPMNWPPTRARRSHLSLPGPTRTPGWFEPAFVPLPGWRQPG